jgi:hypothetical protein
VSGKLLLSVSDVYNCEVASCFHLHFSYNVGANVNYYTVQYVVFLFIIIVVLLIIVC